jgi:aminoglycoside phosphotransferase (APT) family kinase protein
MSDQTTTAAHPETAPVRPGESLAWDQLATYLRRHLPALDGAMEVLQFPNGAANLTYLVSFGGTRLVVRRPPFGIIAPGAHDMRREYRVLSKLWRAYPPAPRALLFCDDHEVIGADFLVSEYRPGQVIWSTIPTSMAHHPDVGRRVGFALVDNLANLHLIDPASCDLSDLGRPEGFAARQVSGWRQRWDLVAAESPHDDLMHRVGDALAATVPPNPVVSILHNDYKLDNCQFDPADPDHVHSVFDWDMATLGDPLVDFGTTLNYWPDPSDRPDDRAHATAGQETLGLPSRVDIIERYQQKTGFDLASIGWYEAFAAFKTAVVVQQLYMRWVRGESTDPRMASRGDGVGPLAQRAERRLAG